MEYIEVVLQAIGIGIFLGLMSYGVAWGINIRHEKTQKNNQEINTSTFKD